MKALVATTHGIAIDTAQQLREYLQEHHSKVSSEQHKHLREVCLTSNENHAASISLTLIGKVYPLLFPM